MTVIISPHTPSMICQKCQAEVLRTTLIEGKYFCEDCTPKSKRNIFPALNEKEN